MTFTLVGFLLAVAPLLLLVLLLSGDVYPGEGAILRLRKALHAEPRAASAAGRLRRGSGEVARGGRLIAASLAGRGPPSPLVSH